MKIRINKSIKEGFYRIAISIVEVSNDEKDKVLKFGVPIVSIEPQRALYRNVWVSKLPLFELNREFIFQAEAEANSFLEIMRKRIEESVDRLHSLNDTFSQQEEYEF